MILRRGRALIRVDERGVAWEEVLGSNWRCVKQLSVSIATSRYRKGEG